VTRRSRFANVFVQLRRFADLLAAAGSRAEVDRLDAAVLDAGKGFKDFFVFRMITSVSAVLFGTKKTFSHHF
jgi:hypothetical protein